MNIKNNSIWGFVGCGNLAQAIISGALSKKSLRPNQIWVTNRSQNKIHSFVKKWKIKVASSNPTLVQKADILILATKPQDLLEAASSLKSQGTGKVIISLAAGVRTHDLWKLFPKAQAIIRVMANTPALVQKSVLGIYWSDKNIKTQTKNEIAKTLSSMGLIVNVKNENQIDAITAACASGVGFIYEYARIFEAWLVKQKFSKTQARIMIQETLLGSALLAQNQSEKSFEQLRETVTSKKGTTLAGLTALKKKKFEKTLSKALDAAQNRAQELSKEFDISPQ